MTGYYVKDRDEALKKALELIPEGSRVAMGGCMSAQEIGLTDALKSPKAFVILKELRSSILAPYNPQILTKSDTLHIASGP